MLFINTRPADRACTLSQALRQQAWSVIELPLLELQACPWSDALAQLYQQLLQAQRIVVVSPTAVHIGMEYLAKSGIHLDQLQHLQWIAVGEKTAQVLAEYGISSAVPEVETSEGMLELPLLKSLAAGSCIAFWRGEGGRQFMMDSLQQAGMQILNFILYQRQCPAASIQQMPALLPQLQQHRDYWMLISSEASWLNWLRLSQAQKELLNRGRYLVLGDRLEALLMDYQQQHHTCFQLIKLTNLKTETILQQIELKSGHA